jgi:hypothetical protein
MVRGSGYDFCLGSLSWRCLCIVTYIELRDYQFSSKKSNGGSNIDECCTTNVPLTLNSPRWYYGPNHGTSFIVVTTVCKYLNYLSFLPLLEYRLHEEWDLVCLPYLPYSIHSMPSPTIWIISSSYSQYVCVYTHIHMLVAVNICVCVCVYICIFNIHICWWCWEWNPGPEGQ